MAVVVLLIGAGGGLATPLQARLMEVADGRAPSCAHHLDCGAFSLKSRSSHTSRSSMP
jgi:hypothetical protein